MNGQMFLFNNLSCLWMKFIVPCETDYIHYTLIIVLKSIPFLLWAIPFAHLNKEVDLGVETVFKLTLRILWPALLLCKFFHCSNTKKG